MISYISRAWRGRATSKFITENCGTLNNLPPGDCVPTDHGFDTEDSVEFLLCSSKIEKLNEPTVCEV